MQVQMKVDMSGTLNGQPWPDRGGTVNVPDLVGAKLCASGQAAPVAQRDADVETTDDPTPVEPRGAEDTRDRDSIIRDLESLDQKIDRRKSTDKLLEELEAATAPEADDEA